MCGILKTSWIFYNGQFTDLSTGEGLEGSNTLLEIRYVFEIFGNHFQQGDNKE